MEYFKKSQRGAQTYIYRVETSDSGIKKTTYLGNINTLTGKVLREVNDYFSKKESEKQYKAGEKSYECILQESLDFDYKLFGDLWLIYQIEKIIGVIDIIDRKIIKRARTRRETPGMYFFIAIANRLINPTSKNKLSEWLSGYDTEHIFNKIIDPDNFNSKAFYQLFNFIDDKTLNEIGNEILQKCNNVIGSDNLDPNCSYDQTNFYTYIATETESELAQRGKNKQGRDDLKQIGLAFCIQHAEKMMIYYKIYPGNMHDSQVFNDSLPEMLEQAKKCGKDRLIIIFDKGNNSLENISIIDNSNNVDFITSYSIAYDRSLASIKLDKFTVINCKHNSVIDEKIKLNPDDKENLESSKIRVFILTKEFWGKDRLVAIIYNKNSAKKQELRLNKNLEKLSSWLKEAKKKAASGSNFYTTKSSIINLYNKKAHDCHLSPDVYELSFIESNGNIKLNYRKRKTFIDDYINRCGKTVLITGNLNFTPEKMVQCYFDHYVVEEAFRQCKDDDCCSVWPIFHSKDNTMRAHIFCCIVSLCFLRILEFILKKFGIYESGKKYY